MAIAERSISDCIPGVFHATQQRSVRIRDSFIEAGVDALNSMRFDDLTVLHLSQLSQNSVGGFYTRFKDKDSYFTALRYSAVQALERDYVANFNAGTLAHSTSADVLEKLVDLMVDIFTSRYRGVLRESMLIIMEPDDPWAPMRESAQNILTELQRALSIVHSDEPSSFTNEQVHFCYQLIVGVLMNELVNSNHVFTTKDDSLRGGLKQAVCAYMNVNGRS